MEIIIDLLAGPDKHFPTKYDIEKNIVAQERAIQGKSKACDMVLLTDTKSILLGIQKALLK